MFECRRLDIDFRYYYFDLCVMRNASASIETKEIIIEQLSQRILAISSKVSISLQYILEWANLLKQLVKSRYHLSHFNDRFLEMHRRTFWCHRLDRDISRSFALTLNYKQINSDLILIRKFEREKLKRKKDGRQRLCRFSLWMYFTAQCTGY